MIQRKQRHYIFFVIISIAVGLFSRSSLYDFPDFIVDYAGDSIWAMMVYFIFCVIFPKKKWLIIGIYALSFSFLIEFSQLYQADWIKEIRSIKLFGLILGYGFKWSDLLAYSIGISLASVVDYLKLKSNSRSG